MVEAQALLPLAAFFGLTFIQIAIGVVYKFSLNAQGSYSYSTASAIALAEFIKASMSLTFHLSSSSSLREAWDSAKACLNYRMVLQLFGYVLLSYPYPLLTNNNIVMAHINRLAGLYCTNNQLTFLSYKAADPASFQLFKSWAAFFTAIILWSFGARIITQLQWTAILLQVCGLMIVQYDACKESLLLPLYVYGLFLLATSITAITSVWNERVVKSGYSFNVINIILYVWGFMLNTIIYFGLAKSLGGGRPDQYTGIMDADYFIKLVYSFFEGYSRWSLAVVACNSVIGLAVSACYKYADAIVKTFATATSTAAFLFFNKYLFHIPTSLTAFMGTFVVFTASYQYMANPAPPAVPQPPASSPPPAPSTVSKGDVESPQLPDTPSTGPAYSPSRWRQILREWWWLMPFFLFLAPLLLLAYFHI